MKKVIIKIEFLEDNNGSLILKIQENNKLSNLTWIEFAEKRFHVLADLHLIILNKHPSLVNNFEEFPDSREKMIQQIRKFVSYFMSSHESKSFENYTDNDWDYIKYDDNTSILNLEDVKCSVNCPVLLSARNSIDSYRNHKEADEHMMSVSVAKVKKGLESYK